MQEIVFTVIASALYFVCSDPELLPRFLLHVDRKKSIGEIKSTDGTKPTDRDKPTGGEKPTDEEKATVGEKPTDEEKATVGERPTDGEGFQMANQGVVGMTIQSYAKVTNQKSAINEHEMGEHLQKFIDFLTLVTRHHNNDAPRMIQSMTKTEELAKRGADSHKELERKKKTSSPITLAFRSIHSVGKSIPFVGSVLPTLMLNALLPKGKNAVDAAAPSMTLSLTENKELVKRGADNDKQLKLALSAIRAVCVIGRSIPFVGSVLAGVNTLLPEDNAVVEMLGVLSKEIKEVKADVKDLKKFLEWKEFKSQYRDSVTNIEIGMKYLLQMLKSTNQERTHSEDRLKKFCKNGTMTKSVTLLAKGLAGSDDMNTDIFETVYDHSGGYRREFERVCIRFLQLYAGGLTVIAAYETLERGLIGASAMQKMFEDYQKDIQIRFEHYLQMYEDKFKTEALSGLEQILAADKLKTDAAAHLSKVLRDKYYWLEICCIVWKRSNSIDYDFKGDHVQKLGKDKKIGVIFYHTTPQNTFESLTLPMPRQDNMLSWFRQSIRDVYNAYLFPDAARVNKDLEAIMGRSDFRLWGRVTMKVKQRKSFISGGKGPKNPLKSLETSAKGGETYETHVVDINGVKHLCVVSRH